MASARRARRSRSRAWLTIPASEEPELAYMGLEDVARKYRVDEELAALRMQDRGEGAPPGLRGLGQIQGRLV